MKICKVEGCNNKVHGKGYCNKHYRQFKRYGEIRRTLKDPNEIVLHDDYAEIILYDMNRPLRNNNTSGITGVSLYKQTNKWRAYIEYNQKYIHLGLFNTKEEAIKARKEAELKYFGKYRYQG